MPRKGPAPKTPVIADPVYNSPVVTALINKVLLHGKRSTAEGIVYAALENCREKTQVDPVITLKHQDEPDQRQRDRGADQREAAALRDAAHAGRGRDLVGQQPLAALEAVALIRAHGRQTRRAALHVGPRQRRLEGDGRHRRGLLVLAHATGAPQ